MKKMWRRWSMGANNIFPSLDDVKHRVASAIAMFYRHDRELLEVDANERSITHKLAEHLQREFPQWHVDCEYNRRGFDAKKLLEIHNTYSALGTNITDDTEAITVFPDIIVHKRTHKLNLLVIEVKKDNGRSAELDIQKLLAFGQDANYKYQFGMFFRLSINGCIEAKLFIAGEENYVESNSLMELIWTNLRELGYEQ